MTFASGDVVAFYLVERYVPSMTLTDLAAAVTRIGELPTDDVRHLWTILVATEDTCLSVFEGPDAQAVEEANARARFHLDRVVEVTPVEAGHGAELDAPPTYRAAAAARFSGSTDAPATRPNLPSARQGPRSRRPRS